MCAWGETSSLRAAACTWQTSALPRAGRSTAFLPCMGRSCAATSSATSARSTPAALPMSQTASTTAAGSPSATPACTRSCATCSAAIATSCTPRSSRVWSARRTTPPCSPASRRSRRSTSSGWPHGCSAPTASRSTATRSSTCRSSACTSISASFCAPCASRSCSSCCTTTRISPSSRARSCLRPRPRPATRRPSASSSCCARSRPM